MNKTGKNSDYPDKDTLRKYLAGELSPVEAHRIEKLLLEDDFLREALEGLEDLDTVQAEEDLEALSARIHQRTMPVSSPNRGLYYRIAAAVVLLAGLSYVIVFTTSRMDGLARKDSITQNQEIEKTEDAKATIPEGDAGEIDRTAKMQEAREIGDESEETREATETGKESEEIIEVTETVEASEEIGELTDIDQAGDFGETMDIEEESEELSGHLANAQELPEDNETLTQDTDEGGDPEGLAIAETKDEMSEEVPREETVEPDLIVQTKSRYAKAARPETKESQEPTREINGRAPVEAAPSAAAIGEYQSVTEPVIGFEAYKRYIRENLQYPERAYSDKVEGDVQVIFIINADSIPESFTIIRSLNPDCDAEAIRLIREGPRWYPVYDGPEILDTQVEYTVNFKIED